MREVDYLIIGAGAVGLTFADTIVQESDATVAIVDRNDHPGGHWNYAYDFVRLHQPSAFYGVNSVPFGSNRKDTEGWNAGMYELASGAEVLDYFERVMNDHLLPSGQVTYYPGYDFRGEDTIVSLATGETTSFRVNRRRVDSTYYKTEVPSLHKRSFTSSDDVTVVPPNKLSALAAEGALNTNHICILGGGKTGMDVGVWLHEQGVPSDSVSWVRPRDSWMMNRNTTQPGPEFFASTVGAQAKNMLALAKANSAQDVFETLEEDGYMLRFDPDVQPSMYHCAIISKGELEILRDIKDVIRAGHVQDISARGMQFKDAFIPMPDKTLYVDCTARAVTPKQIQPVFSDRTVTPQMLRVCQPIFSTALTAHIELMDLTDKEKNSLCQPLPIPDTVESYIPLTLANMMNQYLWSRNRDLKEWIANSRLDAISKVLTAAALDDAEKSEIVGEMRRHTPAAIGNMQVLLGRSA